VLAQRLVRTICDACREPYTPEPDAAALLPHTDVPPQLTRGRGCSLCRGTGYRGRTGIFELFALTDDVREAIVAAPSRQRVETLVRANGMRPLRSGGWAKVLAGVTTIEEVLHVTQE
jgi:type II secretory ATPase GspE/PulE/Tfp pilus assembly ATPase PilB-like protein